MNSPRMRRLSGDYENIKRDFTDHKYIRVMPNSSTPPDRYRVIFNISGIMWDVTRECPIEAKHHEVEIFLPPEYPREKPKCVALTPIFHPNFGDFICIGDFWVAGMTLTDIVLQLGNMIQFRLYNVNSPLNAVAARWTKENERFFPIGKEALLRPGNEDISRPKEDEVEIVFNQNSSRIQPVQSSDGKSSDEIDIVLVKKNG